MNFNPGDKVVCVDDDFSKSWDDPRKYFDCLPCKGAVYVVRGFCVVRNGQLAVQLVGVNLLPHYGRIGGWYPHRFRLLTELKSAAPNHQQQTATSNL